ncbi:SNF1-interacting protein [Mortierella sp. AM989]|nr:SNF1-interacting protein [Mortierella sp. AM989]
MPTNPPSSQSGLVGPEGIAAMIPVANITLEDALLDNPNFRANIKLFEGQVFFIEGWLTAFQWEFSCRIINSLKDIEIKLLGMNEVTSILNKRAELPLLSQGMLSSQYTIPAMKLSSDALRTTLALKSKYITEVGDKVVKPLEDFLKNDLKDFKESKKTFDKTLEKYESTLAKYNGQNRQKEPSALREEAFQLYDTRKAYIQAAMSCSMLCIKFQDALDQLVLGVFLDLIATQHDYFSGNADHFGSIGLQVLQLKTYMKEHQEASAPTLQELEQNKERYIADSIEYWKPSRSLKSYTNNVSVSKSSISNTALGTALANQVAGQVPSTTNMAKPSTISYSATSETSRPPIQVQQFPSQSSSPLSSATVSEGQKLAITQSSSMENLPAAESLTIDTSAAKTANNLSTSSLPYSKSDPNLSQTSTPPISDVVQSCLEDSTPTTKQGYLNIRIPQPRNRAPVWQRKYFFIQEGEFGFESVVSNPTVGSQVVQSERIAVLLCEVRYGSSTNSMVTLSGNGNSASGSQGLAMVQMERRFCFEVVCSTQSYLLQAETEEDLLSWVSTFEAAKRDMLMQQCLPGKLEPEEPYSPVLDSANPSFSFSGEELLEAANLKSNVESGEPNPTGSLGLGWAANVPGVSMFLNSYAGNNVSSNNNTDQANQPEAKTAVDPPLDPKALTPLRSETPSEEQGTEASTRSRSKSVGDPPVSGEKRSGHIQQVSEIEKLMTSSLHLVPKAKPPLASEIPHYPLELAVRNQELHVHFHGTKVHSKEYVLHSWASGYCDSTRADKPIITYGRIYLTQSGMYFYARGLSVETKRMFRFSNIRGIECEQKDISTEWRIETMDKAEHVFTQFTLVDTEYRVLHLIWTNVHQSKDRLPVQELFRRTLLITSKPKGSAGSGSLAETESGHITSREGIMTHPSGHIEGISSGNAEGEDRSGTTNDADLVVPGEDFPENMELPLDPVSCNCPGHLEKQELEQTFDMPAKTLNLQSVGEWTTSDGQKSRVVKFLMVVNNPLVKLNQTDCVENQTCDVEEDHLRYTYTVKSSVLAMPYSDAFTPVLRYCITYVGKDSCKLTCSSSIIWHKNPMVKAMIKGAIHKGTAETVKDITEIIQLQLEKLKKQKDSAGSAASGSRQGAHDHSQSESSKITISLHGPDDGHEVLLDLEDQQNSDFSLHNRRDSRSQGARRHTVSTSGNHHHGHWPTGSSPLIVQRGSKASRTRLLERPSKSSLIPDSASQSGKFDSNSPKGTIRWVKNTLLAFVHTKDEKGRRSVSTKFIFLVLVVSSFINILAAYNSQRMLNSAWRIKEHGSLIKAKGTMKGYAEPLHRILDHNHAGAEDLRQHGKFRNVRVAARAVYLRDLEEQMQSGELDDFDDGRTIDQKCFEIFLEVRDSFRSWPEPPLEWFSDKDQDQSQNDSQQNPQNSHGGTSTSLSVAKPTTTPMIATGYGESDTMEAARYPWLLPRHRQWATKIIFQRDRVGILRHDLLVTFEVLKQLEKRLLEAEYINWIMDEQSRCRLWKRRRDNRLAREHAFKIANAQNPLSAIESDGTDTQVGDDNSGLARDGIMDKEFEEERLTKEHIAEQISRLKNELKNLVDRNEKGESMAPIHGVLRYLETQSQDMKAESETENVNDRPVCNNGISGSEGNNCNGYDAGDTDDEATRRLQSKDKIAEEFCQGLERQVELFMLDPKE